MKILIPVLDNNKENSKISLHFGHAPFFAIYDSENKELTFFKNTIDHSNPNLTPVDQLSEYKCEIVYVKDIGQRAINLFKEKNIILKTGNYETVQEIMDNCNHLEELKKSCGH